MKKIIITGGSGFIGSHLVNRFLQDKNFKILNIDKNSKFSQKLKISSKNYSFIKCDLLNKKMLNKHINNFDPALIINCAAESHVDRSIKDPLFFSNTANIFFK